MSPHDRRQYARVMLPLPIAFRIVRPEPMVRWSHGVLVNLGAGGLRLVCNEPVGEGMTVAVQLTLPIREAPYLFSGTVIWANPTTSGVDCGVAFVDLPPERQFELDELVEFLTKNAVKSSPETDVG